MTHVIQAVDAHGTRFELPLPPIGDAGLATTKARRVAGLLGRLVAPEIATGSRVVVVAVATRAEVGAVRVKVRRARRAPRPAGTKAEADRHAAYGLLVDSDPNRIGHAILDRAAELLDLLDRFAEARTPGRSGRRSGGPGWPGSGRTASRPTTSTTPWTTWPGSRGR